MILLLDIGNARLKWATLMDNYFEFRGASHLHDSDWLDMLANDWLSLKPPERILAVNVATSDITHRLSQWVKQHWNQDIQFAKSSAEAFGLINGYSQPEKL